MTLTPSIRDARRYDSQAAAEDAAQVLRAGWPRADLVARIFFLGDQENHVVCAGWDELGRTFYVE